jgi:hypothetical protein
LIALHSALTGGIAEWNASAYGRPKIPDVSTGTIALLVQEDELLLSPDEYGPSLDHAINNDELVAEAWIAVRAVELDDAHGVVRLTRMAFSCEGSGAGQEDITRTEARPRAKACANHTPREKAESARKASSSGWAAFVCFNAGLAGALTLAVCLAS